MSHYRDTCFAHPLSIVADQEIDPKNKSHGALLILLTVLVIYYLIY